MKIIIEAKSETLTEEQQEFLTIEILARLPMNLLSKFDLFSVKHSLTEGENENAG